MAFVYKKTVQFHETDAMGVVHHANYLRYWEEARVAWLEHFGLIKIHAPHSDLVFAVLNSSCEHKLPCRFSDKITIEVQVRAEKAKIRFRYRAFNQNEDLVAYGHTLHIALDSQFRVCRIPEIAKEQLEKEEWTETWP